MTDTATPATEIPATEAAAPESATESAAAPEPRTPYVQVIKPEHTGARVAVLLQPEEKHLSMPRPKTSRQLLAALGLAEETALVAREGLLLTPDRHIWPGDNLLVRKVASSG